MQRSSNTHVLQGMWHTLVYGEHIFIFFDFDVSITLEMKFTIKGRNV